MRYDELMVHSGQAVFRCRERIRKAGDVKKKKNRFLGWYVAFFMAQR